MQLEKVEDINRQLLDSFGIDTISGQAMWRVVWSDDQFEKRLTEYSDSGVKLLYPEVRELPKYRQWIPSKFVLERLVLVPDASMPELPTSKLSYEPIYIFENANGYPLPPRFDACQFAIQCVYSAQGKGYVEVYKDPEAGLNTKQLLEQKNDRLNELENSLFGDESGLKGKTHLTKEAVVIDSTKSKFRES